LFYRQLNVVGSSMGTRDELAMLVRLMAVTKTRPLIDDVFALSDARDAFARLKDGDVFGKLVLTP
jgi:D-arabinose 1-dehydrogenase-like Zn-dependent alcohol dehydrogenase